MYSVMSFSYFPLRMMSFLGVAFNVLALILLIEVLIEKFSHGTPIAGWASLMSVLLCGFGLVMLMLGMVGEYVWRTLDATRPRPPYIVDEIRTASEAEEQTK